jgi:hypothetical protein
MKYIVIIMLDYMNNKMFLISIGINMGNIAEKIEIILAKYLPIISKGV